MTPIEAIKLQYEYMNEELKAWKEDRESNVPKRASRSEFGWYFLAVLIMAGIIDNHLSGIVGSALSAVILLSLYFVLERRLQDTGRPGRFWCLLSIWIAVLWWNNINGPGSERMLEYPLALLIISAVIFIPALFVFYWLASGKGTKEANEYGEPLGADGKPVQAPDIS